MRLLTITCFLLICTAPAWADVTGADFDNQPVGPYGGGATVNPPGAAGVEVVPDFPGYGGASNLGNGSGNMLRINAAENPGPITVTFTFQCEVLDDHLCRVKYDYAAAGWAIGFGFAVYVDDPDLTDPVHGWEDPLAFPPTEVGPGDETAAAGDCDGSAHQITFVVQPGTIMHIDNLDTECLENVVPNNEQTWSTLKALYR